MTIRGHNDYKYLIIKTLDKLSHFNKNRKDSLKRVIKLVHVIYKNKKGKEIFKLYFSTDLSLGALEILDYYRTRFQIEFLYRDSKQHTGLNWLSIPKKERGSFSVNDIKTINHNWLQLQLFFDKLGINPYSAKNKIKAWEFLFHGTIAA